jgi:pyruvate ferredoxin oxidoreductase gamma subunit
MYRIRFHGRGGQGIKTAGRILGTALFLEGYVVQDAPRYGAERRGAPINAYVRADRKPINERGAITNPDLVIVADDTLLAVPTAGILQGLAPTTVLLVASSTAANEWRKRLNIIGPLFVLPPSSTEVPLNAPQCVGAACALIGTISESSLKQAVDEEVSSMGSAALGSSQESSLRGFAAMAPYRGMVREGKPTSAADYRRPDWTDLPMEEISLSAPSIFASANSVQVRTGLWRSLRPVIDYARCNRCNWVCGSYCPDSAIVVATDGRPIIDYDHCKGCMICVAQCPPHAIAAYPEEEAAARHLGENI